MKPGEHAVAERLDRFTAVLVDRGAGRGVMALEQVDPGAVAGVCRALGRAHEIGELHRGQYPAGHGRGRRAGHELLDHVGEEIHIQRVDEDGIAWDLAIAGAGDQIGEPAHGCSGSAVLDVPLETAQLILGFTSS